MIYYAGIGSRETPKEILDLFYNIGHALSVFDFTLRSGGAKGADISFELGCDLVKGVKEIYLPWKGFENSKSNLYNITKEAMDIAKKYHPYWDRLSDGAKKLQARNSYQVLGYDLKTPSKFILCWTKNGKGSGGTGQAIRIAKDYNIPVFDFGASGNIKELLLEYIKELMKH